MWANFLFDLQKPYVGFYNLLRQGRAFWVQCGRPDQKSPEWDIFIMQLLSLVGDPGMAKKILDYHYPSLRLILWGDADWALVEKFLDGTDPGKV